MRSPASRQCAPAGGGLCMLHIATPPVSAPPRGGLRRRAREAARLLLWLSPRHAHARRARQQQARPALCPGHEAPHIARMRVASHPSSDSAPSADARLPHARPPRFTPASPPTPAAPCTCAAHSSPRTLNQPLNLNEPPEPGPGRTATRHTRPCAGRRRLTITRERFCHPWRQQPLRCGAESPSPLALLHICPPPPFTCRRTLPRPHCRAGTRALPNYAPPA